MAEKILKLKPVSQLKGKDKVAAIRLKKQVDAARATIPKPTGPAPRRVSQKQFEALTGGPRAKDKPKIPSLAKAQTGGVSHIGGLIDAAKGIGRVAGRAAGDIKDLPVNVIKSTVDSITALEQAAAGNPDKARALYEGFRDHDPLALVAQGKLKEAGHEISKHPGNFAVEVGGLKGSVGRGITRGQKALGHELPTRAPRTIPHSPISEPRPYSNDAINRAVQVKIEKRKTTMAAGLRTKADALEQMGKTNARSGEVADLRRKANKIDPTRGNAKQAKVRAARTASVQSSISEANQAATVRATREATAVGKVKSKVPGFTKLVHSPAVTLAAQNIAHTVPEIKAYRERVAQSISSGKLDEAEVAAARSTLKELDKAIEINASPEAVAKAAAGYKAIQDPLQAKLHEAHVVKPEQTAKAIEVPYAATHMGGVKIGAKGPKRTGADALKPTGGVTKTGRPRMTRRLSAADIAAERRAANPSMPEPSFVSNRPAGVRGVAGGRNLSNPKVGGGPRTGKGIQQGLSDVGSEVLQKTAANSQRLADLAAAYRYKLKEAGAGLSLTQKAAVKRAEALSVKEGIKYVPVPHEPFRGNDQLAETLHRDVADTQTAHAIRDAEIAAWDGKATHTGTRYDLVPEAYAKELSAQARSAAPENLAAAALKATGSAFRRTVLVTSPTWLAGNTIEGGLRAMMYGVHLGDSKRFYAEVAKVEQYDPELARVMREQVRQGGHYAAADRAIRERGQFLQHFNESSPRVKALAEALQKVGERPTPARVTGAWDAYTHFVFNQVNGRFESRIRAGMAGAALRKQGLMSPQLLKLSHKAMDDAINGRHDTNTVAALGEEIAKAYGRYDGYTSGTRQLLRDYTPFLAWTLNSTKFVLHTLPKDHPTAVALAAALHNADRQNFDDPNTPDWLQGSVDGRRLLRYTPMGLFSNLGQGYAQAVIPQYMGALDELRLGQDWKGKKQYDSEGNPISQSERAKLAALSFLGGTVPVFQRAQRTIQDPTTLNPFKKVAGKPSSGAGVSASPANGSSSSSSSSGVDWSGYSGVGATDTPASGSGVDWSNYGG